MDWESGELGKWTGSQGSWEVDWESGELGKWTGSVRQGMAGQCGQGGHDSRGGGKGTGHRGGGLVGRGGIGQGRVIR